MNEAEYTFIKEKFGDLIYRISYMITGDNSSCSFEDNHQDLWIAAMDALSGYKRQGNGQNGTFEEFSNTQGFTKYIKTVLWNKKNKKGIKVSKHKSTFKGSVSIQEHGDILRLDCDSVSPEPIESFGDKYFRRLDSEESRVLDIIVNNPNMITPGGKVDCAKLSRSMDTYWGKARSVVDRLREKMEN
tara:strand:- start:2797 stop:3357 length:561 start_codon:yes stop_codon:yes gene_type:complete